MARRALSVVCLAIVGGVACGGGEADVPLGERYDSAGITIVFSGAPLSGPDGAWRTGSAPILDLGGDPEGDLFDVRAVRMLLGERLAYYNGGTCELRIVDMEGRPLRSWGRCGEGPWEFSAFLGIWDRPGDSLLVADQIPARLSVYSGTGELGRVIALNQIPGLPLARPVGLVEDRIVVRHEEVGRFSRPGVYRRNLELATTNTAGQDVNRIGTFLSRMYYSYEFQGQIYGSTLAFSGGTAFAIGAHEIFVGLPFESYEIRVYGVDGSLDRILRRAFEPVAVEDRDIQWLLNRRLREVQGEENRREVRKAFREFERAEVMPAFGVPQWPGRPERAGPSMMVDDAQNLWVFEHYRPGEYANRWSVFGPDGRWLTDARLPDRFIPSHIGEDFVLGHWVDELGLTHIQLHELDKNGSDPSFR